MSKPILPAYGPFPCFPAVPMRASPSVMATLTAKEIKEYEDEERSKLPEAPM